MPDKIRIFRCTKCNNRFFNNNEEECPKCNSSELINAEDRTEPKNFILMATGLVFIDDIFD